MSCSRACILGAVGPPHWVDWHACWMHNLCALSPCAWLCLVGPDGASAILLTLQDDNGQVHNCKSH
eukprot:332887-Pelagomonas_calceolata.AAC.1